MSPSFQNFMAEATRLTRAGDLMRATAVIQAALADAAAPADTDDDSVIEVEAHEVVSPRVPALGLTAAEGAMPELDWSPRQRAERIPGRPGGPPDSFIAGRYTNTAGTREYKLYVPPDAGGQVLPLVVMLHGCTQDPDDFARGTRMNDAASEQGFFVLYPAQARNANPSSCWNWFKPNHQQRDRGEPALLAGMTRDIMSRYPIDPRRVYIAGLSAGGAMAAVLGHAYPDLFAAVGVHSGLPTGSAKDVPSALAAMKGGRGSAHRGGRTPPTIVFHGDRDATVHPANGEQVVATIDGVATSDIERGGRTQGRPYTRRVYRDARGRAIAEHWAIHGAGHAWSGGSPRGSYTDATGPDATAEMLRFFFSQTLDHRA